MANKYTILANGFLIVAEAWERKARKDGLIKNETDLINFYKEIESPHRLVGGGYTVHQFDSNVRDWYNRKLAAYRNQLDANARLEAARRFTEPDMVGFFPKYDPSSQHSKFAYGYGDTETADKNSQIIEIAGVKVIWNKTLRRFEQLETGGVANQFYRVYNPKDAKYVVTESIHNKNPSILQTIRNRLGATYSAEWGPSENAEYNKWLGKDTIEGGHNWMSADASWKLGLSTGDFAKYREPSYKRGILDSLHLSSAIFGRGSAEEKRNALQNLAKRFNISAASLGIPAHAGWADSILGLKVVEKILQDPVLSKHPAAMEFLAAMDTGNVHSHYWESTPDLLHGSSYLTHRISGKSLSKPVAAMYNDLSLVEKAQALEIDAQDLVDSKVTLDDFKEDRMADVDSQLQEDIESFKALLNNTSRKEASSDANAKKIARMVKLIRKEVSASGEGWTKPSAMMSNANITAIIRNNWSDVETNASKEFRRRLIGRALEDNYYAWQDQQQKLEAKRATLLNKYSGKYLGNADYSGQTFYKLFAEGDASTAKIEAFQQQIKDYEIKEKQKRAFEAQVAKKESLHRLGDIQSIAEELNAQDTIDPHAQFKEYVERNKQQSTAFEHEMSQVEAHKEARLKKDLDDYHKRMEAAAVSTAKMNRALGEFSKHIKFYNPVAWLDQEESAHTGVRQAFHGILPQWAERPITRFDDAVRNEINIWKDYLKHATAVSTMAAAGAGAAVGTYAAPGIGTAVGAAGAALTSQLAGRYIQHKIQSYGQGIEERLNMIGMVTSTFGALATAVTKVIGLFGRMSRLWSYMPPYTMSTLTGISWSEAEVMNASDRMLGFQAGTISNMYNNLALQQANLYTSGKFNEDQLVAAARLGIFKEAYAPMGGDITKQQDAIYDKLYKRLYESNLTKGQIQSQLALINQYSPQMAAMLERGYGLGFTKASDFRNTYGYNFLSPEQNRSVSLAAHRFDLARTSGTQALSLAGVKLFDMAEPFIKQVENVLWKFAKGEKIDWKKISDAFGTLWDNLIKQLDLKNVNWKEKLNGLSSVAEGIAAWFKDNLLPPIARVLSEFSSLMGQTKIKFNKDILTKALLTGNWSNIGDIIQIATPGEFNELAAKGAAQAQAYKEEQASSAAVASNWYLTNLHGWKQPANMSDAQYNAWKKSKLFDMGSSEIRKAEARGDTAEMTRLSTQYAGWEAAIVGMQNAFELGLRSAGIEHLDRYDKSMLTSNIQTLLDAGIPKDAVVKAITNYVDTWYNGMIGTGTAAIDAGTTVMRNAKDSLLQIVVTTADDLDVKSVNADAESKLTQSKKKITYTKKQ